MSAMRLLICVSLVPWLAVPAFPQATSVVQISGVVTDPAGASVPNATIKAVQTDTGFTRTTASTVDGSYTLTNLPIGPYRLEVTAPEFKTYVQQGIVLQVNTNPSIHVVLQIGALTQAIEVSANATMVETQANGFSQVIDQRRVVDLPLNGRQATQLILLSGGAVTAPGSDMASTKNYPTSTTISVGGGQANGTYYLLDGGDHNDAFGAINLPIPFPDALQEFSVQTNAIPASYGARAGAVVNIVTKSGTNEIHGDAFEFLRNGVTNARNFFAATRDSLKRNQFGGTVGAPILKNRVFVFGGYQGTRIRTAPATNTAFVATPDALQGNFGSLESAACANATGTFGNSGRNNLQGPGSFTFDAALMRRFAITEHQYIQVRAEAFNILNHAVFGNPTTTLTSSNFGKILGANDPRIMQFALKYIF
jgi:Carboxypeptidase regulatory-like domain